jgi:predicted TIM-barrel fold metal-dependent hydrolase
VLAHWGGGLPFYELMPEIHAVTRNTSYDSAASTYLYTHSVIDTVVRIVGTERVLYGSDYPILSQGRLARRFERTLPDADAREAVLQVNATRVYGLAKENAP